MHERMTQLLGLLPRRPNSPTAPTPDHLDGLLCAALCLDVADDPVAVLDAQWGEDWAESLMEQELLDELMHWLEERWHRLQEALEREALRLAPDALPLADALHWASPSPGSMPKAARDWAKGFLWHAEAMAPPGADPELLGVIAALTLEDGPALQAYLQRAYERPQEIGPAALIDDALFAAQDLRSGAG